MLQVRKQVNRTELAWPLGAMFHVYGQFTRQGIEWDLLVDAAWIYGSGEFKTWIALNW